MKDSDNTTNDKLPKFVTLWRDGNKVIGRTKDGMIVMMQGEIYVVGPFDLYFHTAIERAQQQHISPIVNPAGVPYKKIRGN
jgi:hypothetical protein